MKRALFFILKFAIAAPICLGLGWFLSPYYIQIIGQLSGGTLTNLFGAPIEKMAVETAGILNTKSMLVFVVEGQSRPLPIVPLMTNLPSYLALVLATGGMTLKRKAAVCGIGAAIIFVSHILYVVLLFQFSDFLQEWRQIPEMIILFPFILWIVLAYWNQIAQFFAEEVEETESSEEPKS